MHRLLSDAAANNHAIRVYQSGRLFYYRHRADAAFWDARWNGMFSDAHFSAAAQGKMEPRKKKIYLRYLPRNGRILEAGCGLGTVVMGLRAHGYDVEGVEWGAQTVSLLNQRFPELPVREGDVTALNVPNDTYAGYISLGVIEHRQAGPEPFLEEAFRVLQPGGIALIAVPHFCGLRRIKARLSLYPTVLSTDLEFYQYAFSREEFTSFIEAAGFQVIDWFGSNAMKGLRDELPPFRFLTQNRFIFRVAKHFLESAQFIEDYFGHMQMLVCIKPKDTENSLTDHPDSKL